MVKVRIKLTHIIDVVDNSVYYVLVKNATFALIEHAILYKTTIIYIVIYPLYKYI